MDGAFLKAITLMGIALPTMFLVIAVFMAATIVLHKAFPGTAEENEE